MKLFFNFKPSIDMITYKKEWKGHEIFFNGELIMYVNGSKKNAIKEATKWLIDHGK